MKRLYFINIIVLLAALVILIIGMIGARRAGGDISPRGNPVYVSISG